MSIIARTLDNKRLSYDGRVYIEIPKGIAPDDAVVIQKKRLPHLRGVGDSALIEAGKSEVYWCGHLVRCTAECRGGWYFPIQVVSEEACKRLVAMGAWEEHPEDFNLYRPAEGENQEQPND